MLACDWLVECVVILFSPFDHTALCLACTRVVPKYCLLLIVSLLDNHVQLETNQYIPVKRYSIPTQWCVHVSINLIGFGIWIHAVVDSCSKMVRKSVAKKEEIRAYIKCCSKTVCSLKQILAEISVVYRSTRTNMCYDTVCRWNKRFRVRVDQKCTQIRKAEVCILWRNCIKSKRNCWERGIKYVL